MRLLILGGGFTGAAVARLALAAGFDVLATTRAEARAQSLRALGATALLAATLDPSALAASLDPSALVLVTCPPDGVTDRALAPVLSRRARAIVYLSSTAVYGDASGRVDEDTPLDPRAPRAGARIDAETVWRDAGASVLRSPAIYGPGRGLHLRLARGEVRFAEGARNAISRVHVDDLAAALLALLLRELSPATYVAGDDAPAPHADVVRWLCAAMAIPLPPPAAPDDIDETLRHDRRVDPSRLRSALQLTPAYPTYREGFAHCLRVDGPAIDAALRGRGARS